VKKVNELDHSALNIDAIRKLLEKNRDYIETFHTTDEAIHGSQVDMSVLDEVLGETKLTVDDSDEAESVASEFDEDNDEIITADTITKYSPEWPELLKKYVQTPRTILEKERDAFFAQTTNYSFSVEAAKTENDLIQCRDGR
jgi:hypothetical protein